MTVMHRFRHRFGIVGAIGAALAMAGPAAALEVAVDVDTTVVPLGSSTSVEIFVDVTHDNPGLLGPVQLTGTLPPDFDIVSHTLIETNVGGDIYWNQNTARLLNHAPDWWGETVRDLQLTLWGSPIAGGEPCGVFGVDVHPQTGAIFALIATIVPGGECDYEYTTNRWLYTVDPSTGDAFYVGAPSARLNGLSFLPDGRLIGIGSSGASPRGGVFEVSTADAATTFRAIPTSMFSRGVRDANGVAGANYDDGHLYYVVECEMFQINTTTWAVTQQPATGCFGDSYGAHGMTYLGGGRFLAFSWDNAYLIEQSGGEWVLDDYQYDLDDDIRGVYASTLHAGAGSCSVSGRTFICDMPQFAPRGQFLLELETDFVPGRVGTYTVAVEVAGGGQSATASRNIRVTAADLAAFAAVNTPRVDVGDTQTFTVEVENLGARATNGYAVITPPANTTYQSYTSTQGSCSWNGTILDCNLGSIGAGMLVRITVETTADSNGAGTLTVEASASDDESSLANNTASVGIVVGPASDLVVGAGLGSVAAAPAAQPGAAQPVTFTVANRGPDTAVDVVLRHRVPAGLTLTAGTADAGSCAVADGLLTCDLGDIAAGTTVTVDLAPTPVSSGSFALLATAEAASPPELNPADNSAVLRLQVAPPSLAVAAASGGLLGIKLTHGGETQQALAVRALTVRAAALGNIAGPLQVVVIRDDNGNGRADAGEQAVGNASLALDGADLRVSLRNLTVDSGESVALIFVQRSSAVAAETAALGASGLAALGLLPLAGLIGLRRRRGALLALVLVSASLLPGCGDLLEELLRGRVQVTLTAVEAGLAGAQGDQSSIEGLPLEGPVTEVK